MKEPKSKFPQGFIQKMKKNKRKKIRNTPIEKEIIEREEFEKLIKANKKA